MVFVGVFQNRVRGEKASLAALLSEMAMFRRMVRSPDFVLRNVERGGALFSGEKD